MHGLSLLDRLLLWQKFALISVLGLALTAIPSAMYVRETDKTLDAALLEADGLAPAAAVLKTIQLTQQHRGLSALLLGGIDSVAAKRSAKQQEADQMYQQVEALAGRLDDAAFSAAWRSARGDWETLRKQVGEHSISVAQSYEAHTALVPKLLALSDLVADHYGLDLDPDIDTYQLIQSMYYQLPYLTEELGKMRAKGAGLLAKKQASAADRLALSGIVARVRDRLAQTLSSYNKAGAANPALAARLRASVQQMADLSGATTALANQQIALPDQLSYSGEEYVKATTAAIDAQFAANALASAELETLIRAKIADLRRTRWLMLGTLLGLIALAGLIQQRIARSLSVPLSNAVEIARRVASGDLSVQFAAAGSNETGQLLSSLKAMNDSLLNIVGDVCHSIDNIGAAAQNIAAGNADLSARTESQASSLEQTASSMEQITSTVKQNADNARQAGQQVGLAAELAVRGGQVVGDVVRTMAEINGSSRKIVDIIGVIDGIAFQTNILALNAAVEAARAGEQGRGFAVVASEVRNLAQRSAAAAREIKQLIDESVQKAEGGNRLADQAGKSMDEIVASVSGVGSIMADIVMASQEQTSGIEQVNQAVLQMDKMTQQNAALVEQAAAAAASLDQQAQSLVRAMSVFRLGDGAALARPALGAPARSLPD